MKKLISEAESKMKKSIAIFNSQLLGITGFVTPALVGSAKVGSHLLCDIAEVFQETPTASVIKINRKNSLISLKEIEKAVTALGIGNCGTVDGKTLQISRPVVTENVRECIANVVRRAGEDAKVAIRNVRQETKKLLAKVDLSKDDARRAEKDLQKLTDDNVATIDSVVAKKLRTIHG